MVCNSDIQARMELIIASDSQMQLTVQPTKTKRPGSESSSQAVKIKETTFFIFEFGTGLTKYTFISIFYMSSLSSILTS